MRGFRMASSPSLEEVIVADLLIFVSEQWVLVSVFLLLVYVFVFLEQMKAGKRLSVHDVTRLLNDGRACLVDLRDAKEYALGHINSAINIPHAKMDERMAELENQRDKVIILVDKHGQHSGSAGRKLRTAGFNVCRLRGGMGEWLVQNLPLVTD